MLQQVRPFTAAKRTSAANAYRTRVLKVQCPSHHHRIHVDSSDSLPKAVSNLQPAVSIATGAVGLTAQSAFADEIISQSTRAISPEDVEILAASSAGSGFEQVFVSLLFGVVVLLLAVVTGGVAYMNISQWLDSRQEKEDRDKASKEIASTGAEATADAGEEVVSLRRASRVKKEKGKGFAAAEFTSRR